ncbi:hypothetical protein [Phyllobacterium zundukense]|uniref:Uncharacterized protein n=1 Tax=Phyllobacterium zundukense TaxID=1867719 RepID=A0ACD4CYY9_9HYPH|nr:hypothetical protein [Phyllobacterium zundukense]UXN58768.1 hypothetical protein N8E88_07505 [Phyllobacterium zundukense]
MLAEEELDRIANAVDGAIDTNPRPSPQGHGRTECYAHQLAWEPERGASTVTVEYASRQADGHSTVAALM